MKQWFWRHRPDWVKLMWVFPLVILNNFSNFFAWLFRIKEVALIDKDSYFSVFLNQAFIQFYVMEKQIGEIDIIESVFMIFLPAVFAMLYGTYLYNELNIRGTYSLLRYQNRGKWYVKRCVELLLFAFLYSALQVLLPFLWLWSAGKGEITQIRIFLVAFAFFSAWIFNYFFALLVNLIAVEWGSTLGFIIGYAIIIFSYWMFNQRPLMDMKNMCFLPVRVTLLSYVDETLPFQEFLRENKYQWISLLVLIGYVVILLIYGAIRIRHKDIGLYNQENLI